MATELNETELRAWQALLHTHHQVTRQLDAELRAEHGLNLLAYDVLLRLARSPDRRLRMTELAERVLMSPSGLTRVVDKLVANGHVRRARSEGDARVMLVQLTDQGRELLRRAARTHLRGIREHFTGRLDQDRLGEVADALEAVAGSHQPH